MTVIIANDVPDSVRGLLKRWFLEPRPNVFVGSVNSKVKNNLLDYVQNLSPFTGFLVISSDDSCQGYEIEEFGNAKMMPVEISGLHLLSQKI